MGILLAECVLNTDVEEDFFKTDPKPKRKRVRKRPPKKVVKDGEAGEEEVEVKEEDKEDQADDAGKYPLKCSALLSKMR